MRNLITIAFIAFAGLLHAQECTKNVNGVVVPCTQAEIEQRSIDSAEAAIQFVNDSIASAEAARICAEAKLLNGIPYNMLITEQLKTLQLYLLLRAGYLDLKNKKVLITQ